MRQYVPEVDCIHPKACQALRLQIAAIFLFAWSAGAAQPPPVTPPDTNAIQAEMDAAIHQVEKIVNQTVPAYRRSPGMKVADYSPGWFHPGAIPPDFNRVDVRATQETPYAQHQYVSSDLNPGMVFLGSQLEFNAMTKYFYTNRTLPKKKLTEAEMLEINRLYRVIGRCEHLLFDLENPIPKPGLDALQGPDEPQAPQPLLATIHRWIFTHKPIAIGIVAALLALLMLLRKLAGRST